METKTLIIDGHNLAHRCKYSFSLYNYGQDVSVIYGFFRLLSTYLGKFKPYHVIVCWDSGVSDFRRELVPEYKAQRNKWDDLEYENFKRQLFEIDKILNIAGVYTIKVDNIEADDIIYYLTIKYSDCMIVSNDEDLFQCIDDVYNNRVYSPSKDTIYNETNLEDYTGVKRCCFISKKALQGDVSDNIPGVTGIGEKTAIKLINEYTTLKAIVEAAQNKEITGKIGSNILDFGIERLARNISAVDLACLSDIYIDKIDDAFIECLNNYTKCDTRELKKAFIANNFLSLLNTVGFFSRLKCIGD